MRRLLHSIVLSALPACQLGGVFDDPEPEQSCGTSYEHRTRSFSVDTPTDDLSLELRIESCRVDVDACTEMCSFLLRREQLPGATSCTVEFFVDKMEADTQYTIAHDHGECLGVGRRPPGLADPRRVNTCDPVGAYLAKAAWLEAASVPAFMMLAHELGLLGAPAHLVRAALASARDEVRHAKLMTALARRFGATPPAVNVQLPAPRALESLAIENAVEGCVGETWGALVALWQAHRARDPELRTAFAAIAGDEARHAALAWAIDRWAAPRLSAEARVRVVAAREAAVRALRERELPANLAVLGLPRGREGHVLLARAQATLWAGGFA